MLGVHSGMLRAMKDLIDLEIYDGDSQVLITIVARGELNGVPDQNVYGLYDRHRHPHHGPLSKLGYVIVAPLQLSAVDAKDEYDETKIALKTLTDGWSSSRQGWSKEDPAIQAKLVSMFESGVRRSGFASNYGLTDINFDKKRSAVTLSGSKE